MKMPMYSKDGAPIGALDIPDDIVAASAQVARWMNANDITSLNGLHTMKPNEITSAQLLTTFVPAARKLWAANEGRDYFRAVLRLLAEHGVYADPTTINTFTARFKTK